MGSIDPLSSTRNTVSYFASWRSASSVRLSRPGAAAVAVGGREVRGAMWGGDEEDEGRGAGEALERAFDLPEMERRLKKPIVLRSSRKSEG